MYCCVCIVCVLFCLLDTPPPLSNDPLRINVKNVNHDFGLRRKSSTPEVSVLNPKFNNKPQSVESSQFHNLCFVFIFFVRFIINVTCVSFTLCCVCVCAYMCMRVYVYLCECLCITRTICALQFFFLNGVFVFPA